MDKTVKGLQLDRRTLAKGAVAAAFVLGTKSASAQTKTVIKLGIGTTEAEASLARSFGALKSYVEARSAGQLEVRLFWNTLGGSLQLSQQIRDGTLEMSLTDDAVMAGFHKPIMALQVPYLLDSSAVAWEFMREPALWQICDDMRKATGIRTLGFSENGFRNITNNVRPIRMPEDMKGIKCASCRARLYRHHAVARRLGDADALPGTDPRLAPGRCRWAGPNSSGAILDNKMNEVQKYMSTSEHLFRIPHGHRQRPWFTNLPPDISASSYRGDTAPLPGRKFLARGCARCSLPRACRGYPRADKLSPQRARRVLPMPAVPVSVAGLRPLLSSSFDLADAPDQQVEDELDGQRAPRSWGSGDV